MPPIAPRRRPNPPALLHPPLSTRLDEISFRRVPQSEPFFGQFGPPGRPRSPSNCANTKIAEAGASPPLRAPLRAAPLRRCAAAWLGYAQPKNPKRGGGVSRITSYGRRAAHSRISPHFLVMCVLGPLFFRSSLYQLVLTGSRCPQLPKANHFLAYSALLAGPEALSHPVTGQNRAPSCAATRRPGWATPSPRSPKKSSAFGGR
jgi:hypothetical protein